MKKILCIALVLIASFGASAQERMIDKNEFEAVRKNWFKGLGGNPHRIISITEFIADGKPETLRTTKSMTEFLPGKFHSIFESESINKELIKIGDQTYTREKNGDWKKEGISTIRPEIDNKFKLVEVQTEYKFLGTGKINNQNVNIYAVIERKRLLNTTNNRETVSIATTKYWVGNEPWFWKSETNTESQIGESKTHSRFTLIYEIDPNIKIEAPF